MKQMSYKHYCIAEPHTYIQTHIRTEMHNFIFHNGEKLNEDARYNRYSANYTYTRTLNQQLKYEKGERERAKSFFFEETRMHDNVECKQSI